MSQDEDIARLAGEKRGSLVSEFWGFLKQNKKWWLLPILAVILLLGLLVFLGGCGAAPFIFTRFCLAVRYFDATPDPGPLQTTDLTKATDSL